MSQTGRKRVLAAGFFSTGALLLCGFLLLAFGNTAAGPGKAVVLTGAAAGGLVLIFTGVYFLRKNDGDDVRRQLQQSDKLASLGILVSGVAHEINNPNHTIRSSGALMQEVWHEIGPILDEYRAENGDFSVAGMDHEQLRDLMPVYLNNLLTASRKIETIVGGLRDYARQDVYEAKDQIDLNEVAAAAVSVSRSMIRRATDSFSYVRFEEPILVHGNFQRLQQVTVNLIQNACTALNGPKDSIAVRTEKRPRGACLVVEDTGKGIEKDQMPRLGDPFFTTSRETGGRGLGLAISNAIIDEHGGALKISSAPGRGTTVEVCLPRQGDRRR